MNGPVIFLPKGTSVNPRLRGNNLVTIYGFTEGFCVIPKKSSYMDDETWDKVVKVLSPGIRTIKVRNVAYVIPILLYIYINIHLCPSKLPADDI